MAVPGVVTGQKVDPVKLAKAKRLRRHQTRAERALWQHLRAGRLDGHRFRRQQVIDGFIVDFYCHAAGLVIEVDGEIHRERRSYDSERDRVVASHGLFILRVGNDEVERDLARVLEQISAHVAMRLGNGAPLGRTSPPCRERECGGSDTASSLQGRATHPVPRPKRRESSQWSPAASHPGGQRP